MGMLLRAGAVLSAGEAASEVARELCTAGPSCADALFSLVLNEVWLGLVWFGLVWFGLVWFGLVWFGLVWFGLVWFGLVWFGLVWFGLVFQLRCRSAQAVAFQPSNLQSLDAASPTLRAA